jgi:hypothetical protein
MTACLLGRLSVKNKGPDDEDKLIELLQRGQVQPNDLDEPFVEQDVNVLGDDLDELGSSITNARQRQTFVEATDHPRHHHRLPRRFADVKVCRSRV